MLNEFLFSYNYYVGICKISYSMHKENYMLEREFHYKYLLLFLILAATILLIINKNKDVKNSFCQNKINYASSKSKLNPTNNISKSDITHSTTSPSKVPYDINNQKYLIRLNNNASNYKLTGIIAGNHPIALIDGKTYNIGDKIDAFNLSDIKQDYVILKNGGLLYYLTMHNHQSYTNKNISNNICNNYPGYNARDQNKSELLSISSTNSYQKNRTIYNHYPRSTFAENGSYYGQISEFTRRPKTVHVKGYFRKDGTYVRSHYRSRPR